jgi:hypothetical protein
VKGDFMASEIAQIRQKIQEEYESAKQGLSGLASGTARHAFIAARYERLDFLQEQLAELIGTDEAITIIAHTIWTPTDQGTIS